MKRRRRIILIIILLAEEEEEEEQGMVRIGIEQGFCCVSVHYLSTTIQ
jgi:hypothetical protein